MARQYALPGSASGTDRSDPRGKAAYIRETAKKYGVDPEVALKVAKSEGLSTFQSSVVKGGVREPSWGAFQLYTGGGLGNKFQKETGLDPKDPKNEDATIDYALKYAAKHGWGSWYGAKNTGIGEYEGIGGGTKTASAEPQPVSAGAAGGDASTKVAGTDTPTMTPDVALNTPATASGAPAGDFLDKLKDPSTGTAAGLGEAVSGLGQAVTGSGKTLYDTAPARATVIPAPAVSTPPGVVPIVDPRAVENQRQQLAMAMQRLNSGRLY